MKGFVRKDLWFSLCGLNCGLCPMRLGGHCPGCGGGFGNQSCAIAKCSMERGGFEYCFQCPQFPCAKYAGAEEYDSFVTHQRQMADIAKARSVGPEAYTLEQARRREILDILLSRYNDSRKKGFFLLAANLLPLPDLENALVIAQSASKADAPARLAAELQAIALREGVTLKLRKKPGAGPIPEKKDQTS